MDEEAARRLLGKADAVALERLGLMLREQAKRTDSLADGLVPWLNGNAWTRDWRADTEMRRNGDRRGPWGRYKPAATSAIGPAVTWTKAARYRSSIGSDSWGQLTAILQPFEYHLPAPHYDDLVAEIAFERAIIARDSAVRGMQELHDSLKRFAVELRTPPRGLLAIPDAIQPPRYAKLGDGVLARTFSEDLEQRIRSSHQFEARLTSVAEPQRPVDEWVVETEAFLYRCLGDGASREFREVTSGTKALRPTYLQGREPGHPLLADVNGIARAYVALGRVYLEQVRTRVSDYAEASGQTPPISMDFRGATIYGGQFAAVIKNIDSIIAGIHQHGESDLAKALSALEKAVLDQQGLTDADRSDLLDNVKYLAEAAATPPAKRNRGIVRAVLAALTSAAAVSTELGQAVQTWDGVLHQLTR